MLSTSFTMSGEPKLRPPCSEGLTGYLSGRKAPTKRPPSYAMGEHSLTSVSNWAPTYNDCDKVIQDIYAMTTTARTRRREVQPRSVQTTNHLTPEPRKGDPKISGEGRPYSPGNQDCSKVLAGSQRHLQTFNSIETRMAHLRISEPVKNQNKYHKTSSKDCGTRNPNQGVIAQPNISSIQNRPLPPPGTRKENTPRENIYQSPVRPAYDSREFTGLW